MPHLVVALERFECLNVLQWRGLPHPLYGLPGCHHPDVLHGDDGVQEQLESLLVMRSGEPEQDTDIRYQTELNNCWFANTNYSPGLIGLKIKLSFLLIPDSKMFLLFHSEEEETTKFGGYNCLVAVVRKILEFY